ncbi:MAG TPA: hypothetical protein VGC77_05440 [Rhodopseudomonas sp.]|uniref:hypothetical protein n=1 Tax=Rhodopseudomonas sp. TaxID=1078 RepID=UPI002ED7CA35
MRHLKSRHCRELPGSLGLMPSRPGMTPNEGSRGGDPAVIPCIRGPIIRTARRSSAPVQCNHNPERFGHICSRQWWQRKLRRIRGLFDQAAAPTTATWIIRDGVIPSEDARGLSDLS